MSEGAKSVRDVSANLAPGSALVNCPAAWAPNIGKVLYSTSEIEQRVKQLALQISKDYEGKELVVVGILTGAICFMTDLLKHLLIPYKLDFMMLSSYGSGSKSSGVVMLKKDLARDPSGQHILIVEDLIDTGNTLKWLKNYLMTKRCASVRLCTLLDKKARREHGDVTVDYVGWVCPDEFVVGYGMDYAEDYRCLPFVGALRPEVYMPKEDK